MLSALPSFTSIYYTIWMSFLLCSISTNSSTTTISMTTSTTSSTNSVRTTIVNIEHVLQYI